MMAINYLSYADFTWLRLGNAWLKYAIGLPCCVNTAPTLVSDASVSTINGAAKLCKANTGVELIACLRTSNDNCASS